MCKLVRKYGRFRSNGEVQKYSRAFCPTRNFCKIVICAVNYVSVLKFTGNPLWPKFGHFGAQKDWGVVERRARLEAVLKRNERLKKLTLLFF